MNLIFLRNIWGKGYDTEKTSLPQEMILKRFFSEIDFNTNHWNDFLINEQCKVQGNETLYLRKEKNTIFIGYELENTYPDPYEIKISLQELCTATHKWNELANKRKSSIIVKFKNGMFLIEENILKKNKPTATSFTIEFERYQLGTQSSYRILSNLHSHRQWVLMELFSGSDLQVLMQWKDFLNSTTKKELKIPHSYIRKEKNKAFIGTTIVEEYPDPEEFKISTDELINAIEIWSELCKLEVPKITIKINNGKLSVKNKRK